MEEERLRKAGDAGRSELADGADGGRNERRNGKRVAQVALAMARGRRGSKFRIETD